MATTIATAQLYETSQYEQRAGGRLSDGSYFLLLQDRTIRWTKNRGASWTSKLALTSSYAWDSPAGYQVDVLGDKIYIAAKVVDGSYRQMRFWLVTYNPATETFTATRSQIAIDASWSASSYPSIGVHSGGRIRAMWLNNSSQGVIAYSDNEGASWTTATTSWLYPGLLLRRGTELVSIESAAVRVWTAAATTLPTGTSLPSVSGDWGGGSGIDPDGAVWWWRWEASNRRWAYAKFQTNNTWTSVSYVTPTQRPSSTGRRGFAQPIFVNSKRYLVYSWGGDSACKLAYLENESSSSVEIAAPGVVLSHMTAVPDIHGHSDAALIAIYRENDSGVVKSEAVIFNLPPAPPANPTRANFDARDPARFSWTFSDPDVGDSQSAFKLRLREVGTGTWYYAQADGTLGAEAWLTSSNEYWDLAADELVNGKTYEWQVATKDQVGVEGPYCDAVTFDAAIPPAKAIVVSPADNHDVVTAPQQFVVRAESNDGTQLYVRLQLDTAATFDSGNLIELLSDPQDSGQEHTLSHALLGSQTWYWRARAERVQ